MNISPERTARTIGKDFSFHRSVSVPEEKEMTFKLGDLGEGAVLREEAS